MTSERESGDDRKERSVKAISRYLSEHVLPSSFVKTIGEIRDQLKDLDANRWSTGFVNASNDLRDRLAGLNDNLKEATASVKKLSSEIHRLTFWVIIIAGAGVMVALSHLAFAVFKYMNNG